MKLISLNTWAGNVFEPLIDFIKQHSADTDIFCFQEIYHTSSNTKQYKKTRANLLNEIENILPEFICLFFPVLSGYDEQANPVDFELATGTAIFIKNSIKINSKKDYIIYKDDYFKVLKKTFSKLPTPLQYINFNLGDKKISVFNFHGTPYPGNKLDSKRRLKAINKVLKIMKTKPGLKIIVGDFNLLPHTQSIKIMEKNMRNLIMEFNIVRTRSNLSPYYKKPDFQKFADYIFVSDKIKVKSFEVPNVEISDHLPMILEFD